jgi:hypothetical protein
MSESLTTYRALDAQRTSSIEASTRRPHSSDGKSQFVPHAGNQTHLRRLQAKLTVGAVNDPLEQEADAAADQVMRMADPRIAHTAPPILSRKCAECEEEEVVIQRAAIEDDIVGETAPPIVDAVLASPGRPLDAATCDFMGSRFDSDFSHVRVHTGAEAAHSAAAVGARAYTVGRNVVFGAGEYDPTGHNGRRLLAHELAHVVQQGAVASTPRDFAISQTAPKADSGLRRQVSGGPAPAREAESAVRHAQATLAAGNILFDSWGNDVRDNNNDGIVDTDPTEQSSWDGQHYSGTYTSFGLVAGTYVRGWPDIRGTVHGRVTVPTTRTITGTFRYRVCADVVSQAYADAGLMSHMRSTSHIIDEFRRIGRVWHGRSTFPSEYLPGDFVATYSPGHGGHSGIVTTRSPTSTAPKVIELPGPSTQADAGTYDPASTNDVKEQFWSKQGVDAALQYLGRVTGRHRGAHH